MGKKEKEEAERIAAIQAEITRIKLPRGREVFGIIERRVGGSRMIARCLDGKTRNVRIPGRFKRSLWVRENDVVIIEPWEFSSDDKGDIVYKYTPTQVQWLKTRGHLKSIEALEEF